jgi:cell division protein FtsB
MNKIGISKADQKQRTEQEKKLIYKYEKEAQNLEATEEALIQRLQMLQDEEKNAF